MVNQDIQGVANRVIPGSTVSDPETFLNFLEEQGRRIQRGEDVSQIVNLPQIEEDDDRGFFDLLTDSLISEGVLDNLRDQGLFGRIGANVLGELTSPLGIASTALLATGVGAPLGAGLRGVTGARAAAAATRGVQAGRGARTLAGAGRLGETLLAPVLPSARAAGPSQLLRSPGLLGRSLAAEAGVTGGAIAGGGLAQEVGQQIPGPTRSTPGQLGLGIAGGLVGGGFAVNAASRILDPEAQIAAARAAVNPIEATLTGSTTSVPSSLDESAIRSVESVVRNIASGDARANFNQGLSNISPRVFSETDINGLRGIVQRGSTQVQTEQFAATSRDLALGQGANRGVLIEFATDDLRGSLNFRKPGLRQVAVQSGQAEVLIRDTSPASLANNVVSIEIDPRIVSKRDLDSFLELLAEPGEISVLTGSPLPFGGRLRGEFSREILPDGRIRLTPPNPSSENVGQAIGALRQRLELSTASNKELAADLRQMRARGAEIGSVRAGAAENAAEAGIAFRSGQSGLRLNRTRFEPLVELPEGGTLVGGIPSGGRVNPTAFAEEVGITSGTINAVRDRIGSVYGIDSFQGANTQQAFYRLMLGDVPSPGQLDLLEPILGGAFINQIKEQTRTRGQRGLKLLIDTIQLPLAIMSSFDMSAIFRQGLVGTIAHPRRSLIGKNSAFVKAVRAAASDDFSVQREQQILNDPRLAPFLDPNLPRGERLEITNTLLNTEEQYLSGLTQAIPGISQSERFYTTYLNEIRSSMVIDYAAKIERQGIELTPDAIRTANQWANAITGRGNLPFGLESRNNQFANAFRTGTSIAFWSPRLLASRFQSLFRGGRAIGSVRASDPAVRQISRDISKEIAIAAGGIGGSLYAASFLPGVSVELNPKSSDFGKARIGNTRIDPWAGFQQVIRYATQYTTGERKSASSGEINGVDRDEVLGRFLRSKLAPGLSSTVASDLPEDLLLGGLTGGGQNFIGEPITGGDVTVGAGAEALTLGQADVLPAELNILIDQLIPLLAQDIAQAMEADGLAGGAGSGLAAFFGLGSTSFNESTRSEFVDDQRQSARNPSNPFTAR